jgi:hypothetical protein
MTLRLDPKYHGVRVARVRPKKDSKLRPSEGGNLLILAPGTWFKFVRRYSTCGYKQYWAEPSLHIVSAAANGKLWITHKEALEALGLR